MTKGELLLFGERIRNQRNALGLTQEAVAEQIGVSLRFYQMVERGEKCVSVDTMMKLSRALNASMDYLLLGEVADNPLSQTMAALSPQQRQDAIKILELYARGR